MRSMNLIGEPKWTTFALQPGPAAMIFSITENLCYSGYYSGFSFFSACLFSTVLETTTLAGRSNKSSDFRRARCAPA